VEDSILSTEAIEKLTNGIKFWWNYNENYKEMKKIQIGDDYNCLLTTMALITSLLWLGLL
jgi:hypothetical protein